MKVAHILRLLHEAREAAEMNRAGFRLPRSGPGVSDDKDTREIIEATRLYRRSWIITPLDTAIDELEKLQKARRERRKK